MHYHSYKLEAYQTLNITFNVTILSTKWFLNSQSKLLFLFLEKQNCPEVWLIHFPASGGEQGGCMFWEDFLEKLSPKGRQTRKTKQHDLTITSKHTHEKNPPKPNNIAEQKSQPSVNSYTQWQLWAAWTLSHVNSGNSACIEFPF